MQISLKPYVGWSVAPILLVAVVGCDRISEQEEWQAKTLAYVAAVNSYVEKGLKEGWDKAGEEPVDPGRDHLAKAAIAAVRQANLKGNLAGLRDRWPPAHSPLIELLEENGQRIPVVCILPDESIVAHIGAAGNGRTVRIVGDSVSDEAEVAFFGRGPNRGYFAVAQSNGVRIVDGWNGPEVTLCRWPTRFVPAGFEALPFELPPTPTRLIPFPDGKRTLLVSPEGIFVLSATSVTRLLPTTEQIKKHFAGREDGFAGDLSMVSPIGLSMEHGAVSKDGKLIAVGSQDSTHLVFDDQLALVGNVGNQSEYPHYALFSWDDALIAFNSCHFYYGNTIGVPTSLLPGLKTEPFEEDHRIRELEDGSRVYAGVSRNDEFIIGDADGYVRAFSTNGQARWRQFIGSTVGDIDISADGKTLVVSTYAGFLSIFKLDAGKQAPHQIGNGNHFEARRWIFWRNESRPLIW